MAVHKLYIEDFDQVDYNLIAIHTTIEDYRLAFKLNQNLSIALSKNEKEIPIEIKEKITHFSRFTYQDDDNMMLWDLIKNKQQIEIPITNSGINLFENKYLTRKVSLVSELKKVDYFLKIEHDTVIKIKDIIAKIKKINTISTVYEIDANDIKSKNNLIF